MLGKEMRFPRDLKLKTPRCILRHVSESDIPHVFSASRAEGLTMRMQWEPPSDQSKLSRRLRTIRRLGRMIRRMFVTITTHNAETSSINLLSVRTDVSHNIWDLGFWTTSNLSGSGYMSEAVERILRFRILAS